MFYLFLLFGLGFCCVCFDFLFFVAEFVLLFLLGVEHAVVVLFVAAAAGVAVEEAPLISAMTMDDLLDFFGVFLRCLITVC